MSKQLKLHLLPLKIQFSLKLRISHWNFGKPFQDPGPKYFHIIQSGKAAKSHPLTRPPLSLFTICSSGQGTDVVGKASWAPGWGLKNMKELNFHYSEIGQNLMESIHVAPSAACDPANNFILKILSTKTSWCPWLSSSCCRQIGQCHLLHFRKNNGFILIFIAFEWHRCSWINSILSIISTWHFDLKQKAPIFHRFLSWHCILLFYFIDKVHWNVLSIPNWGQAQK